MSTTAVSVTSGQLGQDARMMPAEMPDADDRDPHAVSRTDHDDASLVGRTE